jgi:hypothetical protein
MSYESLTLEELIIHNADSPEVLTEIKKIVALMFREFDFEPIDRVFHDILRLFAGNYPGYRKCNTSYHDLQHTTECLLVMAQLMHGAFIKGIRFSPREVRLGLISALMHDTGYIQAVDDSTGTGAKYTLTHIQRSIKFMEQYFRENGYPPEDFSACRNFLKCTGLDVKINEINFPSRKHEILGKMLGTADLIGQMADEKYVEKLHFLYQEFKEGGVPGFEDEFDLLKKTPSFWNLVKKRFATELGRADRFLRYHFRVRWGIDQDLHRKAIERNLGTLQVRLQGQEAEYPKYSKRDDFVGVLLS